MNTKKKHHKTIVLSDIHIGSKWSKVTEVIDFLKTNSCDTLILAGDIIDGWYLQRKSKNWNNEHTEFLKILLDIQNQTKIIYVKGNHDDFLNKITPFEFLNISIVKDYIYETNNKRYFVLHGDIFDHITTYFTWLSKVGDLGYSTLLLFNRYYNLNRAKKGLPYYSISNEIKKKTKLSVSFISKFEKSISQLAKRNNCDGVICGHIHQSEIKKYGDIEYLNSGDWVESLTALTEDYFGNWDIFNYHESAEREENEIYEKVLAGAI